MQVALALANCDNCGSEDEACRPVRRVYLVPETVVLEEIEQWCAACRSQYPHAEPSGPDLAGVDQGPAPGDEESSAS